MENYYNSCREVMSPQFRFKGYLSLISKSLFVFILFLYVLTGTTVAQCTNTFATQFPAATQNPGVGFNTNTGKYFAINVTSGTVYTVTSSLGGSAFNIRMGSATGAVIWTGVSGSFFTAPSTGVAYVHHSTSLCAATTNTTNRAITFVAQACTSTFSSIWTENFDGLGATAGAAANALLPCGWSKTHGEWATSNAATNTYNDPRSASYYLTNAWTATNETVFTRGFDLTAGVTYTFDFYYAGDGFSGWTGDVIYNTQQTVAGATILGTSFVSSGTTTAANSYTLVSRTFTPATNGRYFFGVRINATSAPFYLGFDDFSLSAVVPCSGTPAPGNTVTSSASVAPGGTVNLSLQTATSGTGVTYQWQSAPTSTGTWTNFGTSSATQTTAAINADTWFRCRVTCGANTGNSTPVQVVLSACVPTMTYGCTDGDVIARVILNTLDNNSGTGCPSGTAGYSNYTTNPALTTTLLPSSSYNCIVYAGQWAANYAAWIDYNDNLVFEATERIGYTLSTVAGSGVAGVLGSSASFPVTLACNPPAGQHILRIREVYNQANGSTITPCGNNEGLGYGEIEDYKITIAAAPACPSPGLMTSVTPATTSAVLTWATNCASTSSYDFQYGPAGFTLGSGTTLTNQTVSISAPNASYTLSGLTNNTNYNVYYRANCGSGVTSAWSLVSTFTTLCAPSGNEIAYGNGSWIGYVYNSASDGAFTTYKGYVTEAETFNTSHATTPNGATIVTCPANSDLFAIRYKMTKNFTAGNYTFQVGGDDGVRLSIDGGATWLINGWLNQGYTTYTSSTVSLSGNVNLVFEFYESTGGAQSSFAYFSAPVISSVPSNSCIGSTITISGSNFVAITGVTINGVAATSYNVVNSSTITAVVPNTTDGVVTVTSTYGTSSSSPITIYPLLSAPSASVLGASTINVGGTATLTSSAGANTSWYNTATGGASVGSGDNWQTPVQCTAGTVTYYAEDNNGTCPSASRTAVSVTVRPIITSNPSNALICQAGGSVTLSAQLTGATGITWSPNTNLSTTSGASTVASPTATTVYTMSATVAGCGSVSGTQTVGVIDAVAFTPTSTPASVCAGNPAALASNLSSSGFTYTSMTFAPSVAASPVILCNACGVDDGGWNNVPIPFTYNFFGNNYTTVNVGSNGVLQFGSSAGLGQFTYNSGNFPNVAYPANVIAAAAVDLYFTSGSVRYFTDGIAPTRKFVIEYFNVAGFSGGSNTVQIKLCETTGIVEIHVTNASAFGGSANKVVGLQDLTQTIGATAYSNTATITNTAWKFVPGANYTFQWSDASGIITPATSTTYTTPNLSTPGAVTYSVAATNPNTQCTTTQSVNVTVNALPAAPNSSGDVTACSSAGNQSLTVTTGAGETADWFAASTGGTVLASGDNVLTYSTATAGTYYAAAQNTTTGCSSVSRTAVTLSVNASPAAPTVTTPVSYCQGSPASTLTATAAGANTLNWYSAAPSYPSVSGATALGSAPTPTTSSAGSTNYYVSQSSSANGCESQLALIAVSVNATPSSPTASNPAPYCQNAPSSALTATATGGGTLYWYTDPTTNAGQTTTAPTPSTATAGTTNYYVSERNASGCESARTTITVTVTPSITASVTNSASSTSACGGGSIAFTATPTNGGTPAYQWYLNGAPQSGETAATYTLATPADADQIYVAMTPSAQTCLTSASATNSNTVTLTSTASTPTVSIQSSTATTVCTGTSVTFSVLSSANMGATPSYQWLLNGSAIGGATSSTYTTTGLVNNDVVTLEMTSSLSAACLTSSTATSAGITYTINPATAITTSPVSAAVCAGGSQNFSVVATGTGTLTYQWKKNGVNITGNATALTNQLTLTSVGAGDVASYTVVVTGTCSSATSAAASLTLNTATSIGTQPVAVTQCATTTAVFTVVASGQGTLTYQWRKDGSPLAGETAATLSIANISLANAGNYSVVVTGTCGAVTSSNASLTVNPATTISSQPVGSTICASNTANFSVTASGQGTLTYQWQLNGSPISGATSSTLTVTNAQAANAGSYTVIVTGACGSITSNAAVLVVNPSTAITTQPAPVSACLNGNATFTVVATGTGTLTYQWKKDGVNVTGNASATTSTLTLTGLTAADAAIYSVVVSGGTCGVSSVTSNLASILTVNALPTVTANVTTTPVCLGSTTTLTGGGASTYSWNNGVSNAVSFAPAATTTYTVTGTSAAGCTNTASILVAITTPTITATAVAGTVVWNGATSVDFGTSSNWLAYNGTSYAVSASAPTASTNVIIPVNQGCVAQQPSVVLSGTVAANDVVIESGATLSMGSGVLNIHGNYTNNGTLVGGTGTVAFVGASGNQSITKTGGESFPFMTVNKASGNVVLNNNVTVTGGLTLTNGLVVLGANNLSMGSATLSGGSSSSYVKTASSGVLKRNLGNSGAVFFPVGNTAYNPAELTNTIGSDIFSVRVVDAVYVNGTSGTLQTTSVVNRTWMIEEATSGGNSVNMKLYWNGAGEEATSFTANQAFVAHYVSSASTWDNMGGGAGLGYVESTQATTSFSPFTISSSPTFAPLPVELLSLDAQCAGENVIVSWKTASEHNSLNFVVERSENGTAWSEIQTVGAAGNSNTVLAYAIEDAGAARGVNYYRLIQTDQDGVQKVYGPVMSNCGSEDNVFMSFPNPSDADITLMFTDKKINGSTTLTVRDAHGRVVRSMALEIQPGTTSILIPDMELEPAVYYLQLVGDNFTSPVIKHSLR